MLLILTSAVWGLGFVAQRAGMEFVGPFLFNAVRFALGSLSLVPLVLLRRKRSQVKGEGVSGRQVFIWSLFVGVVLFLAASLQQVGIVHTTAGKAGFITGLYVVLVPILGMAVGHRTGLPTWAGAALAVAGLYLLSVTRGLSIEKGDLIVLVGSCFWAVHVLCIDRYSRRIDPIVLSCIQFAWCSLFSFLVVFLSEPIDVSAVLDAAVPILYGGLCSVGVAYTLQVVAQRNAPPAHAAIILSMEALFAVIGGVLILHETLTARGWTGCACMLAGMLITQWEVLVKKRRLSR